MDPVLLEGIQSKPCFYSVLNKDGEIIMDGQFYCHPKQAMSALQATAKIHKDWEYILVLPSP